jgi:G3E family GTPase
MNAPGLLPVTVLTGFLGSGKTTLLSRVLKSAAFSRTAVIINEFGAIGLDHDLVEASDESFIELSTGCMCCTVRGDLVLTLRDLLSRRDAGTAPLFERIVIETSGLADPAPILHALMTDAGLTERLQLAAVITTVDAATGTKTLVGHPEAVKQIALADQLVLTKTDLASAGTDALVTELHTLNPSAPLSIARFGDVTTASQLFEGSSGDIVSKLETIGRWLGHRHAHDHHAAAATAPQQAIATVSFYRDEPIHALTLTLLLQTLAEQCGANLLRLKGIVAIAEIPERPAVLHGVQHVFHPPTWLERWPSTDHRSRFVFIGRNLSRPWLEALIDVIEEEVCDAGRVPAPTESQEAQ